MSLAQFHNVTLDVQLSLGAHVKVAYQTKVIRTREGDEERVGEWQDALRTFDIQPALRHQQDLDYLTAFFRSRLGPVFAFKMQDPTDFIAHNEACGVGDGIRTIFPLVKIYTTGLPGDTHSTIRPVTLPDVPITVYLDGGAVSPSAYVVDALSGIVTLTNPPPTGVVVSWSGTFQVPVRFHTTQMYTSFEMYQRFQTQITLVEVRAPVDHRIVAEAEPGDFADALFPPAYSERSETGPQFDAIIVPGSSGVEERIGQFLTPTVAFRVDQALQSLEDMSVVLQFFHARRGRLVGFYALDETDFQAVNEQFALGDGITTTFQLTKSYVTGGFTQVRTIAKLASTIIALYINGVLRTNVRVVTRGSDVEVIPIISATPLISPIITETGRITFATPPPIGASLTWTGQFYVPVRFDTDELDIAIEGPDVLSCSQIGLLEIPTTTLTVTIADIA